MLVPVSFYDYRRLLKSRGDLLAWSAWIFCDLAIVPMPSGSIRRDQVLATTEMGPQPQYCYFV